jgi:hypothetical protein
MNIHGEFIQNRGHKGIARKPKPASEEVTKNNDFIGFGGMNLLIEGSATVARRKESDCLIFPDQIGRDLRFAKDKGQRERL